MADPDTLDHILRVGKESARLAGQNILEAGTIASSSIKTKSSSTDLVTETDRNCETIITDLILLNFPNHKIIGEETAGSTHYQLTDSPTWTIDPIDGTTNFVHQLQLSCVIVSYLVERQVTVAVIYDPYADELFYAVKGRGAFVETLKGTKETALRVSSTRSIPEAVISMDCGYGRSPVEVARFCSLQSAILCRGVRNIRMIGSTGLNMAKVAAGRLNAGLEEGSWSTGLGPKIWDFAAGKLLVEEAGGVTRDLEVEDLLSETNQGLDIMKRSFFCAGTPELATELLQVIGNNRAGSAAAK